MNTFDRAVFYTFLLAMLLIAVAYYQGFGSGLKTVFSGIISTDKVVTGRNEQGNFANYPQGA